MSFVLTLIANPDETVLTENLLQSILQLHNITPYGIECLGEGRAYDVFLDAPIVRDFSSDGLDAICQPTHLRQKKLLIADMDSTIVTGETLDDLAEYAGLKEEVAAITMRAMNGEIGFREALEERVMMLKGLSAAFMEEAMAQVQLTPGAKTLVATMKANGAYCALVSGGFTFFTERVADMVGFDKNVGNRMEIVEGQLSGAVLDPIVTKDTKLEQLLTLQGAKGLQIEQTLAVGDGANDLPMILKAGLGIAYHAKPSVVAEATHSVRHGDLTALLFAQGYKDSDFILA